MHVWCALHPLRVGEFQGLSLFWNQPNIFFSPFKGNHSKGSKQYSKFKLTSEIQTYEVCQKFRDNGPKLFKGHNLVEGNG